MFIQEGDRKKKRTNSEHEGEECAGVEQRPWGQNTVSKRIKTYRYGRQYT